MTRVGFVWAGDPAFVGRAEAIGVDSLWVGGHIAFRAPISEPVARLARLATLSSRAAIGTAVTVLPLYPPALVAKQVADIDVASGGRVTFGIGVGGDHPPEFAAAGVPLAGRGARTDEAIAVLRQLWSGRPVHHAGPLFPMDAVRIDPPPAQPGGPPIVVAGRRVPAMRRAALLGDGWMPYLYSPQRYARSVAEIGELAAAAGRGLADFAWMAFVFAHLDGDHDRARATAGEVLSGRYGRDVRPFIDRVAVAGDADAVGERLAELVAAGAEHLVVAPLVDEVETLERIMAEVVPGLRGPASPAAATVAGQAAR